LPGDAGLPPFSMQLGLIVRPRVSGTLRQCLQRVATVQVVVDGKQIVCNLGRAGIAIKRLLGFKVSSKNNLNN